MFARYLFMPSDQGVDTVTPMLFNGRVLTVPVAGELTALRHSPQLVSTVRSENDEQDSRKPHRRASESLFAFVFVSQRSRWDKRFRGSRVTSQRMWSLSASCVHRNASRSSTLRARMRTEPTAPPDLGRSA